MTILLMMFFPQSACCCRPELGSNTSSLHVDGSVLLSALLHVLCVRCQLCLFIFMVSLLGFREKDAVSNMHRQLGLARFS